MKISNTMPVGVPDPTMAALGSLPSSEGREPLYAHIHYLPCNEYSVKRDTYSMARDLTTPPVVTARMNRAATGFPGARASLADGVRSVTECTLYSYI
jgi:hypothetical protein